MCFKEIFRILKIMWQWSMKKDELCFCKLQISQKPNIIEWWRVHYIEKICIIMNADSERTSFELQIHFNPIYVIKQICRLYLQQTLSVFVRCVFKTDVSIHIFMTGTVCHLFLHLTGKAEKNKIKWMTENEWQAKQTQQHFLESSWEWKRHATIQRQGVN